MQSSVLLRSLAGTQLTVRVLATVPSSDEQQRRVATVVVFVQDAAMGNRAPQCQAAMVRARVFDTAPIGSIVTAVEASDPDMGDTLEWSIATTALDAFDVDSRGVVRIARSLRENLSMMAQQAAQASTSTLTFNVRATDRTGAFCETMLVVAIETLNTPPAMLATFNFVVQQCVEAGAIVGQVTAVDPDGSEDARLQFFIDGDDARFFRIDNGGTITSAADFAQRQNFTFIVRVIDEGGAETTGWWRY